ncbi:MAG: HNH endonuclease, partial [Isosphaeraceae bacterium]
MSGLYKAKGRPKARPIEREDDDFSLIATYGSIYRGYVQYYKRAHNLGWFGHLHWAMYWSLLRTLALIHKTTANAMRVKYAASHTFWEKSQKQHVTKRVLKATRTNPMTGREYVALFGDMTLRTDKFAPIQDGPLQKIKWHSRSELIDRLLANRCEICWATDWIEVHHVRALKDLTVPGRRKPPIWKQIMAARKRKT